MESVLKKIVPLNGQHLEEKDIAKGPRSCYPRNALHGARKLTSWPAFLQRAALPKEKHKPVCLKTF